MPKYPLKSVVTYKGVSRSYLNGIKGVVLSHPNANSGSYRVSFKRSDGMVFDEYVGESYLKLVSIPDNPAADLLKARLSGLEDLLNKLKSEKDLLDARVESAQSKVDHFREAIKLLGSE